LCSDVHIPSQLYFHPRNMCSQTLVISFMVFLAARVWLHDNYPFIVLYSIVNIVVVLWLVLIKSLGLCKVNSGCPFCPSKFLTQKASMKGYAGWSEWLEQIWCGTVKRFSQTKSPVLQFKSLFPQPWISTVWSFLNASVFVPTKKVLKKSHPRMLEATHLHCLDFFDICLFPPVLLSPG